MLVGLILFLLAVAPSPPQERVSPFAFRKVVERARPSLVRIVSEPRGTAVLVGVHGELLTSAHLVRGSHVSVEYRGETRTATLVVKDEESGAALLALAPGDYPAAAVGSPATLAPGRFLVGLSLDASGELAAAPGHVFETLRPAEGGPPHLRTDVAGPAGSALFNSRAELVALHVGPRLATVPIDELRARLTPRTP